ASRTFTCVTVQVPSTEYRGNGMGQVNVPVRDDPLSGKPLTQSRLGPPGPGAASTASTEATPDRLSPATIVACREAAPVSVSIVAGLKSKSISCGAAVSGVDVIVKSAGNPSASRLEVAYSRLLPATSCMSTP